VIVYVIVCVCLIVCLFIYYLFLYFQYLSFFFFKYFKIEDQVAQLKQDLETRDSEDIDWKSRVKITQTKRNE